MSVPGQAASIPRALLSKLSKPCLAAVDEGVCQEVPAYSRLLRCTELPASKVGACAGRATVDATEGEQASKKPRLDHGKGEVFQCLSH